ncbi:MAG: RHS repeat-associated core domain-containing protein [Microthrixaceae bacterium]
MKVWWPAGTVMAFETFVRHADANGDVILEIGAREIDTGNLIVRAPGHKGPYYHPAGFEYSFQSSLTNTGVSRYVAVYSEITFRAGAVNERVSWLTEITVEDDGGDCAARREAVPSPDETSADTCASPNATASHGRAGDPVHTGSGVFSHTFEDLSIPGRGAMLGVSRTYNSYRSGDEGPFGFGWFYTYGVSVDVDYRPGAVGLVQSTGAVVRFDSDGSGGWDAPGRVNATLTENPDGSFTYVCGGTMVHEFNADGVLTRLEDLNGDGVTLSYVAGQLSTVTHDDGRSLSFGWTNNRVTTVTDANENPTRVWAYAYDGSGDLQTVTDPSGGQWAFTYDGRHRLRTMRDPNQPKVGAAPEVTNTYDVESRVVSQSDRLGGVTTFDYTTLLGGQHGDGTLVTHPVGAPTVDWYDNGVRVAHTKGYGTTDEATWAFVYDPATTGITQISGPDGTRTAEYFPDGGLLKSNTDQLNRTTSYTYNSLSQPTTITANDGVVTTNTHDSAGNLTSVATSKPGEPTASTTFGYDDPNHPGDVTSVTDVRNKTWSFGYDANGLQTSVTDPEGNQTTSGYNGIGWLIWSTSPKGNLPTPPPGDWTTDFAYDLGNRTVTVNETGGATRVAFFDANGNLSKETVTGFGDTAYTYDDDDRLIETVRSDATVETTRYWPDGQVKEQEDAAGNVTAYSYDGRRRLQTVTDPAQRNTSYTYTTEGWIDTIVEAASRTTTFGHHDDGRIDTIDYSDPATPDVTATVYDDVGRRTSVTQSNGQVSTRTYDHLGRVTSSNDGGPGAGTSYRYDGLSTLVDEIDYPHNLGTVTRVFDDAGRMTSSTDWNNDTTTFGFDQNSNIELISRTGGQQDSFSYDTADRMVGFDFNDGATDLAAAIYGRMDTGHLNAETQTGLPGAAATTWDYNSLGFLTEQDSTAQWNYDTGDRLEKLLTGNGTSLQSHSPASELCFSGPVQDPADCTTADPGSIAYTYDDLGNRTDSGPSASFAYDQANRLVAASVPADPDGGEGQYHEITATRILDTRTSTLTGTCTPSPCATLTPGNPVDVSVGVAPIPTADVAAVAATVTIAGGGTGSGYARVNNSGTSAAATVNFTATTANRFVIAPVVDGKVNLEIFGPSSLNGIAIVDVTGYYTTGDGSPGTTYHPTNPSQRLLDTRSTTRTGACPTTTSQCTTLTANTDKTIQASGRAGLPSSGVTAVVVNVTVANQTAAGLLRVAPGTTGGAGTINYTASGTVNDVVVVPLDANGRFELLSTKNVDVIADIAGYYTTPTSASTGSILSTVTPARIADTRSGSATGVCDGGTCTTLAANTPKTIKVRGLGNVTNHATTAVVFITVAPGTTTGFLRVNPVGTGTGTSGTSTINYAAGVRASTVIAPIATDGTITVAATTIVDVIVDVSAYMSVPTATTGYAYNSDGLRVAKTHPDTTTTEMAWDHSAGLPLLVTEKSGSDVTAHLYGPDGGIYATIAPDNTTTHRHRDQLGSVRLATDDSGTVVGAATYAPYGTPTVTGEIGNFGYAGEYTDPETGFQYLRARYYDPSTGQFLTRDPLTPHTRDPYGYAHNNPTNLTDPTGLCPLCLGVVAGALASAALDTALQVNDNWARGCSAFDNFDVGSVATSAAIGGIMGGTAHLARSWAIGTRALGSAPSRIPASTLPSPSRAAELIRGARPVGSALKNDAFTRAPTFVVDDIASNGSVYRIIGGDGVERTLIQSPGQVNGLAGRFEWLVDDLGNLTHQKFIKGGSINGLPNVP